MNQFYKLKNSIKALVFMFCLVLSFSASAQTNFASLGADDSGGIDFKTVLNNNNLVVSNVMMNYGTTMATSSDSDFSIKARGVDDFTFEGMNFNDYQSNEFESTSKVVFKDKDGNIIQEMTLDATKPTAATSTSLAAFFDNGTATPIYNVAEIIFSCYDDNSHSVNFAYEDITISIPTTPILSTTAASSITTTSATLAGNITSDNGFTVTGRGVVHSTTDNTPTIDEDGVTQITSGTSTGAFNESITSLSHSTTYYFQAYAINSKGTAYGGVESFTTLGPEMAVKGNSTEIADGDAVPTADDHTDFGSIDINAAPFVRTFTIENTGTALLTLGANAVTLSGTHASDYTLSSQPATTVTASGSTTFQISFNPLALGVRTAELSIANDDSNENPYNIAIKGTRVNAPPTAIAPIGPSVTEDATDIALANGIAVVDGDRDNQTVSFTITGGTLTTGTTGITFGGDLNGSASFTAAGTLDDINNALDAATFTPTPNLSGSNAGTISFTTNDGTATSSAASVTFDITAVNDEPTLTATALNPTFTEDYSAAVVFGSASASTVESGQSLTGFIITVAFVNDGASEILNVDGTAITLTNGTGTAASFSYNVSVVGTTAMITLTGGVFDSSSFETLINAISYQNNSNTPNTSDRVVAIIELTDSGASTGDNDNINSTLSVESTVTVVAANDEPSISIDNSTLNYVEDNAAIQIDATATLSDPDGDGEWDGGQIVLEIQANDEDADEISLSDTDGDGITITISGSDIFANGTDIGNLSHNGGVVTGAAQLGIYFNSDATNAIVQEVFQSLRYRNTSDNPGTFDRLIAIAVFDKTPSSTTVSRTISVTSLDNDAPTITTNSTLDIDEAASAGISSVSHLSASDADDDDAILLFTVTSNTLNGALKKSGTTLEQDDTFTQADLIAGNMSYTHDGTNTDSDSFIFKVSDDNSNELTNQTFSIDVNNYTQTPTLTLPSISSTDNSVLNVDFTLPEAASSGTLKMTFSRTGGTADGNAPHILTFVTGFETAAQHTTTLDGTNLSANANVESINTDGNDALVDGAIYSVSLEYQDVLLNAVASITSDNLTYDNISQQPTLASPANSSSDNASLAIDFTLPEAASPGTVKMTFERTGGTVDANAPHVLTFDTGFESAAQHTTTLDGADLSTDANVISVSSGVNDVLVNGAIYSVKLEYQDAIGNSASFVSHASYTYDLTTQPPTLSSPASSSSDNASLAIDFTLPEAASPGTAKMTFTCTGGTDDTNDPHILTFKSGFESAAQHTTTLNGADLSADANVFSVSSDGNDFLVNGAIYSVRLAYQDAVGNSETSSTNTVFTYDLNYAPSVTTQAVSSILTTTATGNGTITDLGFPNPTQYGVCWSTSTSPTISGSKTEEGAASATGTFTSDFTGLTPGTTYHLRAYATNSSGTSYGDDVTFTADKISSVTTQAVSSISTTTATANGNMTDLGVPNPTQHGFCWNTGGSPTVSDSNTEEGSATATGAFTSDISDLIDGTTYHVRAYAENQAGISYGSSVSFTTQTTPTVQATNVVFTGITSSQMDVSWIPGNGSNCIAFMKQSPVGPSSPTDNTSFDANPIFESGTQIETTGWYCVYKGTENSVTVTGLTRGTTYLVFVCEYNGLAGSEMYNTTSVTGNPGNAMTLMTPVLTTQAVSDITSTTATGNGNITDLGLPNPTQYGVCWSTSTSPTISDPKTEEGSVSSTGAFISTMTGLTLGETYYVRAYAINAGGTSYGNEISFTVLKPSFSSTPITIASSGVEYTYSATASDGTATNPSITCPTKPVWLNFSTPGSVLLGTPLLSDIGPHNVVLNSSNDVGSVDQAFTVTVSGPSTLSDFPDLTGAIGSNFTLTAPSSNSNGIFTFTSSDNAVATISGNTVSPLLAGTTTITATQAADGYYTSTDITCTLTVNNCTMPVADVTTLPNVTGECSATVSVVPTATSNCAGTLNGTTDDPLSYTEQGTYMITWTYNDGNGNIATQGQSVIVDDVTNPVAPILADVTGECSATATAPTTSDACSGTITGTTSDPLTYDTQGTHVIAWTFDDGNGNSIVVNQNVVIDDVTDPVAPTLADVTGECSATATAPTTSDNCSGTITGTTSDPLTYDTQGTHVIAWTFDDGNGNSIVVNQNVVIDDVTDPIVLTQDITVQLDAKGNASIVSADIDNGSSDNCSISTMSLDKTEFDIFDEGENTVTLTVADMNENSTSATAIVTIKAHLPVVSASQLFSVSEDASNGTSIGTLLATDPLDGTSFGEWTIITGNDDKIFSINSSTGELTIADQTNLDYETVASYTLGISVSDGVNTSLVEDVIVNITNVNDNSPVVTASQRFFIDEDAANNTSFGTVLATDADAETTFSSWIISTGNDDAIFAINPATAKISIADNSNLNFETSSAYALGISVSDGISTSVVEDVLITIRDVNESPVAIAGENQTVADNTIVELNAWNSYDPDGDYLNFVWYAPEGIELSDVYSPTPIFTAPNVDIFTDYIFTLIVNDGELYSEESSVTVTVDNVTGISDIGMDSYQLTLYPNPSKGAFTIELEQRPVDGVQVSLINLNAKLIYSQKVYEKKNFFNLSLASGMYILKVEQAGRTSIKKIIIE